MSLIIGHFDPRINSLNIHVATPIRAAAPSLHVVDFGPLAFRQSAPHRAVDGSVQP